MNFLIRVVTVSFMLLLKSYLLVFKRMIIANDCTQHPSIKQKVSSQ